MRKLVIFLFLVSFASPVFAGVRIINNGGGYAEMMALTAFARLKFFIIPCLQNRSVCGLSEKEHEFLALQVKSGFFDNGESEMEFHVPEDGNDLYRGLRTRHEVFSVASTLLYDENQQPKSYREIARLVYIGLYKAYNGRDMEDVSQKIFGNMLIREQSLPLTPTDRIARAFTMQSMLSHKGRDALLFLETKSGVQDVTSILQKATKCKEPKLLDITGLAFEAPTITGNMTWRCEKTVRQAQFALHTHILHATVFKEVIHLFQKCEDDLL